jgi:hypothetical protein
MALLTSYLDCLLLRDGQFTPSHHITLIMAIHAEQTPFLVDICSKAMVVHQVYRFRQGTLPPRCAVAHVIIMFKEPHIVSPYPGTVMAVETLLNRNGTGKGMFFRIAPFAPKGCVTPSIDSII